MTYESCINLDDKSLIYQSSKYINFLCKILSASPLILNCDQHGVAMPFISKKSKSGIVYNSLPFFGSNGGVVGLSSKLCPELLDDLHAISNRSNFLSLTIIESPLKPIANAYNFPFNFQTQRVGAIKLINKSYQDPLNLMASYHSKTRNLVRKSFKGDLRFIQKSNGIHELMIMHFEESKVRNRKSKPENFFMNLENYFVNGTDFRIFSAEDDDGTLAMILVFYLKNKVAEYYLPTSNIIGRNKLANYFLIHNILHHSALNGVETWNWGGSHLDQADLVRFKSRWGSDNFLYNYYTLVGSSLGTHYDEKLLENYKYFFIRPYDN
jgi:hypothetical protein